LIGQKHAFEGTKAFLKGRKPDFFVNFGQFSWTWIRIRNPSTDPDTGQPNQCGCTTLFLTAFRSHVRVKIKKMQKLGLATQSPENDRFKKAN
jgi:hypothetical protein